MAFTITTHFENKINWGIFTYGESHGVSERDSVTRVLKNTYNSEFGKLGMNDLNLVFDTDVEFSNHVYVLKEKKVANDQAEPSVELRLMHSHLSTLKFIEDNKEFLEKITVTGHPFSDTGTKSISIRVNNIPKEVIRKLNEIEIWKYVDLIQQALHKYLILSISNADKELSNTAFIVLYLIQVGIASNNLYSYLKNLYYYEIDRKSGADLFKKREYTSYESK